MPRKYNWSSNEEGDEHVLRLSDTAEGWVIKAGPLRFEAALIDHEGQVFLWTGEYATLPDAKRAVIAAAKRFDRAPLPCEPEAPMEGDADEPPRTKSIWEWDEEVYSLCTWFEGNGLGIDGVVTAREDGLFEGDVVLGITVLREEYKDAWSAKRGVITKARALIEQAV